jgi:hypothetical protein
MTVSTLGPQAQGAKPPKALEVCIQENGDNNYHSQSTDIILIKGNHDIVSNSASLVLARRRCSGNRVRVRGPGPGGNTSDVDACTCPTIRVRGATHSPSARCRPSLPLRGSGAVSGHNPSIRIRIWGAGNSGPSEHVQLWGGWWRGWRVQAKWGPGVGVHVWGGRRRWGGCAERGPCCCPGVDVRFWGRGWRWRINTDRGLWHRSGWGHCGAHLWNRPHDHRQPVRSKCVFWRRNTVHVWRAGTRCGLPCDRVL